MDNKCICCGAIIPEGLMTCPNCTDVVQNKQCDCYYEYSYKRKLTEFEIGYYYAKTGSIPDRVEVTATEGRCYGTREMERCRCGGDKQKCDFYGGKQK